MSEELQKRHVRLSIHRKRREIARHGAIEGQLAPIDAPQHSDGSKHLCQTRHVVDGILGSILLLRRREECALGAIDASPEIAFPKGKVAHNGSLVSNNGGAAWFNGHGLVVRVAAPVARLGKVSEVGNHLPQGLGEHAH